MLFLIGLSLAMHIFHLQKYFLYYTESIPTCGIVSTVTVFAVTISYYNRDGKDNHTFNNFFLASGITLSTVRDVIFNLVLLNYVGSCYYKPKCLYRHIRFLYRHTFSFPSRTQKMFYVYYICNCTTYVTLNDTVVAHL